MFADKIDQIYKDSGLTLKGFCDKVGVSVAAFRSWVQNGRVPYPSTLSRLSRTLNLSVDELLDGSQIPRGGYPGRKSADSFTNIKTWLPSDTPTEYHEKIQLLAQLRGTTPQELASSIASNPTTAYKVIRGMIMPRLDLTQAIANYFHVPVYVLLDKSPMDIEALRISECQKYSIYNLGCNLKCLRAMSGLMRSTTAQLLHTSSVTLDKYESGKSMFDYDFLYSACELYNVTPRDMTGQLPSSRIVHEWFMKASQGQKLKYLLQMRGLKLSDVAIKAQVGVNAVNNSYFGGTPSDRVASRIAEVLNVPLSWVYTSTPTLKEKEEIR